MKCPLSNFVVESEDKDEKTLLLDCLEEECAWWDKTLQTCAISRIANRLDQLTYFMAQLANRKSINVQLAK